MNARTVTVLLTLGLLLSPVASHPPAAHGFDESPGLTAQAPQAPALLKVAVEGAVESLGIPVFVHLAGADDQDYVITQLPPDHPGLTNLRWQVLDEQIHAEGYVIALERIPGSRSAAVRSMPVLLDDGLHLVVQGGPGQAEELASLGFSVALLPDAPVVLRAPETLLHHHPFAADPRVEAMIGQVTQTAVWDYTGNLSGENLVSIGGAPYTILTRHTSSGTPIQKATQYVHDHMVTHGLEVSYHNWTLGSYSGRNVIGQKTGLTRPNEIVLVTAHLDSQPSGPRAPGADDNASGSVGVMLAAEIMKDSLFERTVRFVFFTGEEQGLLGARRYAEMVSAAGQNIVAVFNMDMIAWSTVGGPVLRLHTRRTNNSGYPGDLAIATTFTNVVSDYGLTSYLSPIIDPSGITASDHSPFWDRGYSGILAIEDDRNDFNPYYHTVNDLRQHLNMTYFTNYVKASVGTAAHLAIPADPPCQANMTPITYLLDAHAVAGTDSNVNQFFEPGEKVLFAPTWQYPKNCSPAAISGVLSDFSGPAGFTFSLVDKNASYGAVGPQMVVNCFERTGNCYILQMSNPTQRPQLHVDVQVTETLSFGATRTWTIHVGNSFLDVPSDHWAYTYVESLLHSEITAGCGPRDYCPGADIDRWQMAVFIARAIAGDEIPTSGTVPDLGDYSCEPGGVSVFSDIEPEDPACPHVHFIAGQEITAGCGGGAYCPASVVTRWQMAVFLAKALAGDQIPVSGTVPELGSFDCVVGGSSVFDDVDPADPGCPHIHYLAANEITAGCGGGLYCPSHELFRDQMAVFITRAFDLVLP